jgi:1,4-dihydroxy-2-naphthoyl-CoA hydrolase
MSDDATKGVGTPAGYPAFADLPPAGAWLRDHGLVLDEISGTRVTAHIELSARHWTPWGVVHGGVYTTAIESVASVGASAAVVEQGQFAVGVNNTTDFLRSMREGTVDIVAEPVIQGRVQQLWRVTITRRADGKAVAQGQVRLQNVPLSRPE